MRRPFVPVMSQIHYVIPDRLKPQSRFKTQIQEFFTSIIICILTVIHPGCAAVGSQARPTEQVLVGAPVITRRRSLLQNLPQLRCSKHPGGGAAGGGGGEEKGRVLLAKAGQHIA
ncbi:hypothetical protein Pmani_022602 [Petrolisthes manimaculis]|uniref:Uncharacterized protein n=1 Tax=Petrolisthes manimaculis TaxID=1843537 RepID=A0AAE1U1Y3_9EUCA|nr:hypothetical protein Pmani_022602 [Petrolisthes manimaculis]